MYNSLMITPFVKEKYMPAIHNGYFRDGSALLIGGDLVVAMDMIASPEWRMWCIADSIRGSIAERETAVWIHTGRLLEPVQREFLTIPPSKIRTAPRMYPKEEIQIMDNGLVTSPALTARDLLATRPLPPRDGRRAGACAWRNGRQ